MANKKDSTIKITDDDLPSLFRSADKASKEAQGKYLRLIKSDLFFLIAGAILSSVSIDNQTTNMWIAILGAILISVSVILTLLLKIFTYEKEWYGGRAIAESTKTLAWRYIMCAEPFKCEVESKEIDGKFLDALGAIFEERKELAWKLDFDKEQQITNRMRELRKLSTKERIDVYSRERINDQKGWYGNKSKENRSSQGKWFWAIIVSQIAAVISSILMIVWHTSPINPTGIIAAMTAAFFSWIQVKSHQGLAQSYAVAAYELGLVADRIQYVKTDEDVSQFVSDAENAISREHTLWAARRDKIE